MNHGSLNNNDERVPLLAQRTHSTSTSLPVTTASPISLQTVHVYIVPTVIKLDGAFQQIPPLASCGEQDVELCREDVERAIAANEMAEVAGKPLHFKHDQPWKNQQHIKCVLLPDENQKWYLFLYSPTILPPILEEITRNWDKNIKSMMLRLALLAFVYGQQSIFTNFHNYCNENPIFFATHEMETEVALRATLYLMGVKCKKLPKQYLPVNLIQRLVTRITAL